MSVNIHVVFREFERGRCIESIWFSNKNAQTRVDAIIGQQSGSAHSPAASIEVHCAQDVLEQPNDK